MLTKLKRKAYKDVSFNEQKKYNQAIGMLMFEEAKPEIEIPLRRIGVQEKSKAEVVQRNTTRVLHVHGKRNNAPKIQDSVWIKLDTTPKLQRVDRRMRNKAKSKRANKNLVEKIQKLLQMETIN